LHPFSIDAWVVLPEHLHAVWTLPAGDSDFLMRWGLIKRGFSSRIEKGEARSASRIAKAERGIWQRRFWEHTIRDAADFRRHVDYIHFNRSSMAWWITPRIGRSHRFGGRWRVGNIRRIGMVRVT
jgi:putative transposase